MGMIIMSAPMATRLLSFLSLVEDALKRDAMDAGTPIPSVNRIVNYPKGLARLTIDAGGGTILFQHFDLADGETCVRATATWANRQEAGHAAIYPQGDDFDWRAAASRVAAVWIAGPKSVEIAEVTPDMPADALRSAS